MRHNLIKLDETQFNKAAEMLHNYHMEYIKHIFSAKDEYINEKCMEIYKKTGVFPEPGSKELNEITRQSEKVRMDAIKSFKKGFEPIQKEFEKANCKLKVANM